MNTPCLRCLGTREATAPAREYTFMNRKFTAPAQQVVCPECSSTMVRGVAEHHTTKLTSIVPVQLTVALRERDDGVATVLSIKDGAVTGYESFYVSEYLLDLVRDNGWLACAGSEGRFDRLFIPAKEMVKAVEALGLKGVSA